MCRSHCLTPGHVREGPAPGPLPRDGDQDGTAGGGSGWARSCGWQTHQEPVKVHESEKQEECVEEEVEGNVRHRAQAAVARGVQDLEREPVEAEPEPVGGAGRETGQGGCGPT